MSIARISIAGWVGVAVLCAACAGDDTGAAQANVVNQTPPQTAAALEQWLKSGAYKAWQCEPALHESRAPSPHGYNRICSNDVISAHVDGDAPWPKGAAAVKELFAAEDDEQPGGYAVYLKTADDSAGGANWYWYERLPASAAQSGSVADGMGDAGPAKDICVACHVAAGSDAAHTPSSGGRDQVYTPVR